MIFGRQARLAVAISALIVQAACTDPPQPDHLRVAGGEPELGRDLMISYGCGTCHTIDDIPGARGRVGPILDDYATRTMLAGVLPNTPPVLVAWLIDPPAIVPRTAMPAMGIDEGEARHMAAYLYTLGAADAPVYPAGPPLQLDGQESLVLPGRAQPPDALR